MAAQRRRPRGRRGRGELEASVMDVLWDASSSLTPAQVREQLAGGDLAYTTVLTILVRLCDKGLALREPAGRGFAYRASATRDEWVAQRMRDYLALAGEPSTALAHFLDGIERRDARTLRQLIDRRRRR